MRAETSASTAQPARLWSTLQTVIRTLGKRARAVRPARKLRVCEAVPLGDKRFVAVVQFEQTRFLIGGATNSIVLLTRLEEDTSPSFTDALAVAERGHA